MGRRLKVKINCLANYTSTIEVPDGLSLEEAIEHAKDIVKDIPMGELKWVPYSDEIDESGCAWEE